jgi:hypothetical protein
MVNLVKVSSLIIALDALLVGESFLLQYLSKNPVYIADTPERPGKQEPKREDGRVAGTTVEDEPVPAETIDPAQLALAKEETEQRLGEFLRAKKSLDRTGGADWGGDLYAEMIRLGQEGDAFFMDKDYASDSRTYGQALEKANWPDSQRMPSAVSSMSATWP